MLGIADIHCHVLPYVDDGAQHKQESMRLLKMQYQQGVRTICFTPHLRHGMFETPDEEIIYQFERLKERVGTLTRRVDFYLSREYFCDSAFIQKMEHGELIPYGNGNFILTEFSHGYTEQQIVDYINLVLQHGYRPLIAHVERYPALTESPTQIKELIAMGAKIQMNAGSILGKEGMRQAAWCRRLLKERLVHVIGSDAHDTEMRPPQLEKCANYLERKVGSDYTKQLMRFNPYKILGIARRKQDAADRARKA